MKLSGQLAGVPRAAERVLEILPQKQGGRRELTPEGFSLTSVYTLISHNNKYENNKNKSLENTTNITKSKIKRVYNYLV